MPRVTGQIFKIFDKNLGRKTLYSIKLEDDPIYYRLNENRYPGIAEAGNWVEFEATPNADGKSAQVVGAPKKLEKPATVETGNSGGGFNASREAGIQYQSARKDALQFVAIAVGQGAIKLPAKQSGKLKALEALVDTYTALYYEDIGSGGAVARATAAAYADGDEAEETVTEDEDE